MASVEDEEGKRKSRDESCEEKIEHGLSLSDSASFFLLWER